MSLMENLFGQQDNTRVVRNQPNQLFWNNGKIDRITTPIMEDRLTADKRDWSTRQFNKLTESPIGQLYSKAEQIPVVNFVLPSTEGLTNFVDNRSSAWNKATGALEAVPLLAGTGYKGVKAVNKLVDKAKMFNGNKLSRSSRLIDDIASNNLTNNAMNNIVKENIVRIDKLRALNLQGFKQPIQPTKHIDQFNALQKDRLISAIQDIRQGMERKGYPKEWYRQFNPALANNPDLAKREIIKSLKRDNTFARGTASKYDKPLTTTKSTNSVHGLTVDFPAISNDRSGIFVTNSANYAKGYGRNTAIVRSDLNITSINPLRWIDDNKIKVKSNDYESHPTGVYRGRLNDLSDAKEYMRPILGDGVNNIDTNVREYIITGTPNTKVANIVSKYNSPYIEQNPLSEKYTRGLSLASMLGLSSVNQDSIRNLFGGNK